MKRILMAIALSIAVSSSVAAQSASDTPATKEDVQKYLDAMHSRDMMRRMVNAMSGPMHSMVHDQFLKLNEQYNLPDDFEARMNKAMDELLNSFPWEEMIQSTIPAYQKHLSKEDLAALTAFYSSPVGQKILRELPAATADAMEAMQPIMMKQMELAQQRVQEQIAEMLKEYQHPPKKSSTTRN